MNWAEPEWLKLLLAPGAVALLLIALSITRRREGPVRWPGIRRVVAAGSRVFSVPPGRSVRRPWLMLIACAVAIIALARPRWGEIERPVFQQAREVMLALDLSRSMLTQDVAPDRLSRARLLVASLLDGLRGERVGLIVFAGTAFVQVPLSADYQILNEFLPELDPAYMPQGGTDFAGMLRAATNGFSDAANTDRFLIVLSDGEALDDSWREQLPGLEKLGVRVIALGVGTTAGGFIPDEKTAFVKDERGAVVLSRLEPATLRSLAQQTGGVYRDASAWVDLAALLAETVERGRRGEFTEERSVDYVERFQWFLAPAVLIAALGLLREIGIRPRSRNVIPTHAKPSRARRLRVKRDAPATTLASLVALSTCVFILPTQRLHAAEPAPPPTPDALVRETITRIAGTARPGVADWRELAERTLAYGAATREAGAPVPSGPVLDALSALDEGEKLDPSAADWSKLRDGLEELLEQPPPSEDEQKQDEQKQEDQQNEEKEEQDKEKQDQESGEGQSEENEQQQQEKQEGGEQGDDSQQKQDSQEPKDSESQSGQQNQEEQPPESEKEGQSASEEGRMGELEDEKEQTPAEQSAEPAGPPPPPKQEMKKFGGKPSEGTLPPTSNPELAAALRQLKEATKNDSPAKLFEMLEGQEADRKPTGKDW